jgi:ribonuclease J
MNLQEGQLLGEPEVITRGFIYVKESEEMLEGIKGIAFDAAQGVLGKKGRDSGELRGAVKSAVSNYLFKNTKRSPMIIPMVTKI